MMKPNEAESAVHGCHRRGDMVVRIRKVLAIRGVGTCDSVLKLVLFNNIEGVALNRVYTIGFFCPVQSQSFKPSAAHLYCTKMLVE